MFPRTRRARTKIFQVKFCTNYEKFIHIFLNFREISLPHIPQPTRTYTNTHTHTHKYKQHRTCLRRNIFSVSYPVFPLRYEALVSSCRKFPHKQLQLYWYSYMTCCVVPCVAFIVLQYVNFYTTTFLYTPDVPQPLSNRSQSTHTSTITNGTTAHSTAQHCYGLLYRYVP